MSSFLENLDHDLATRRPEGFEPLGKGSERHGSWEWTYYKHTDLHRFVTVAFTPMARVVGRSQPPYHVEVFAGAEDDHRFVRHLVRSTRYLDATTDDVSGPLKEWLNETVRMAARTAARLGSSDLLDTYPSPRRSVTG